MRKVEDMENTANSQHVVELMVDDELTWTDWFGFQGDDLTEEVVAPQGCYITQWKIGIQHLQGASCGLETFNIPIVVSIQGKCNNGQWLEEVRSAEPEEYEKMAEQPEGYFKLTGQSGGWLTGMLDCGNDRDDRWEATAKTDQGQACKVVAYQMRLDGGCAGARFGFDDPAANRQRTTAPSSQDINKLTTNQDGLKWTDWFGSQGRKLTEKVVAPQGCHITQWKLGIKHLHAYCGSETFDILVVLSVQGKCSNGEWLKKSPSSATAEEYRVTPEEPDGYYKLTGQSGGWLTGMLDCGNDRDDHWEATKKSEQGEDCRVVAYQLRLDGDCACARFGFDSLGEKD